MVPWVVTPCSRISWYQYFCGTPYLHIEGRCQRSFHSTKAIWQSSKPARDANQCV